MNVILLDLNRFMKIKKRCQPNCTGIRKHRFEGLGAVFQKALKE